MEIVCFSQALELAIETTDGSELEEEGSGSNGIETDGHNGTTEDYDHPAEDHEDSYEGAGHVDEESQLEESENTSDHPPPFGVGYQEKPPRYTNQNPVPLHAAEPMPTVGNMTKIVALKTFSNTKVYIPVLVPQRAIKVEKNRTVEINRGKQLSELSSPVSSIVKATSKLEVKNNAVKPLKYDENFTILVAKRNKTEAELKRNATNAEKILRRRRRAPYSYEESGEAEGDYGLANSMEFDDVSGIQEAGHDYDNDYEYVKPDMGSHESGPSGNEEESSEGDPLDETGPSGPSAPDAYDIHGYRGEQHTTRWPPNSPMQPAYALSEGQTPAPHMKSGRPQTFKPQLKDYGAGHHRHPGGATSSSSFNMGNDEHHHHHFYDRLKETHQDKPPYYKHSTKFLVPPEIYKRYPGKHKHFHHVKTPEGQKVITESEEDDANFDPNTLTDKDHEDAYKTYDEEDIAVDVNYDDSDKPQSPPPPPRQKSHQKPYRPHKHRPVNSLRTRPITVLKPTMPKNRIPAKRNGMYTQKHMMKYKVPRIVPGTSSVPDFTASGGLGNIPGAGNKAEVERIFEAVGKAMRSNPSLTSPTGPTGPTGSVGPSPMLWPLGFPKGLPLNKAMPSRLQSVPQDF